MKTLNNDCFYFGGMLKNKVVFMYEKENFNKSVGSFLKNNRNLSGLSGQEVSKLMRLSQQQISRYENGQSSLTVYQLSMYLKVLDLTWLDFVFSVIENEKPDWDSIFKGVRAR